MPSIIYSSYDRYPAPKGAGVHIGAFTRALAAQVGSVALLTLPPEEDERAADEAESPAPRIAGLPPAARVRELELGPGLRQVRIPALGATIIDRVLCFRAHLLAWWGGRRPDVAHVRSIFEGYPVACRKPAMTQRLVLEVNGVPSIELKYHYPQVADDRDLLSKLRAQEQACLDAADLVLTVSDVNAAYLQKRGVDAARLRVIPNGVSLDLFAYRPPRERTPEEPLRVLYSGTFSAWQGVHLAIDALALYRRDFPARLTVVGGGRIRQRKQLEQLAADLGVRDYVDFLEPVDQAGLAHLHHQSDVVVAPLTANDRNLEQGCCPLKVLEAMAAGTPLVASDLPVVAALARPESEAILVRPGSAKAIKDGLLRLREDRDLALRLSAAARRRVEEQFTWQHAQDALVRCYRELGVDGRRKA